MTSSLSIRARVVLENGIKLMEYQLLSKLRWKLQCLVSDDRERIEANQVRKRLLMEILDILWKEKYKATP